MKLRFVTEMFYHTPFGNNGEFKQFSNTTYYDDSNEMRIVSFNNRHLIISII